MFGWHHRLNGHEFKQTPGNTERQRSLVCYSSWGHKELDMILTEQQKQGKNLRRCMVSGKPKSNNIRESRIERSMLYNIKGFNGKGK